MTGPQERESAFVRRWACLGLLLIAVAAVRSEGHYRSGEHFQTIEFASFKLGRTPAEALPWEFRASCRPSCANTTSLPGNAPPTGWIIPAICGAWPNSS